MPLRVGQPGSLVKAGDPVPGKPNHYYESGQIAPSVEHLTSIKLQEMNQAGLLPDSGLDIYNKEGEISESKLKELNIQKGLQNYNIGSANPALPAFAFVGLASVFNNVDEDIFNYLRIEYIDWMADAQQPEGQFVSLQEQAVQYSEITNTADKNIITGYGRKGTSFSLVVFQPFFVYLSVPVVPAIKNVSTGLNVSSVSTLKTLGYMVFDRLRITDKSKYVEFLNATGWKQKESIASNETARYRVAGSEVGISRGSKWYRDSGKVAVSTSSTVSPKETFSEMFMFYYVHRMYLAAKNVEYVQFMKEFIDYIGHM